MALIEREAALEICEKEYQERLRMLDYCGDTVEWNIGNAIKGIATIDPIKAAGGCYCRECRRCDGFPGPGIEPGEVGICKLTGFAVHADGWCKWSEPREAQDDG